MISGVLAVAATSELPLGINPWLLLAQIFNFLILWYILARWVFPALFRTLDDRAKTINEGVEKADRAKSELEQAKQKADALIQDAQRKGQQVLNEVTVNAEKLRVKLEDDAHASADRILQQEQQRIKQLEAQTRNSLMQEVADIAIHAATQVIGESLDGPKQRKLVQEFLDQSPSEVK